MGRRHPAALGEDRASTLAAPAAFLLRSGHTLAVILSTLFAPHLSGWLSFSSLFVGLSVDPEGGRFAASWW